MNGAVVVAVGTVSLRWEEGDVRLLPGDEAAVTAVWQEACAENAGLFDGRVLTMPDFHPGRPGEIDLAGRFAPYRYVHAQRRLGLSLGVSTIGVSGVCLLTDAGADYAIVGRRGAGVTDYAGFLELLPSGGISARFARLDGTVDYTGQLAEEFVEETGLPSAAVTSVRGFALLLDRASKTYDVACRIVLQPGVDRRVVEGAFAGSGEYVGRPQFLPVGELSEFAARHHDELVPTSAALIEALNT